MFTDEEREKDIKKWTKRVEDSKEPFVPQAPAILKLSKAERFDG